MKGNKTLTVIYVLVVFLFMSCYSNKEDIDKVEKTITIFYKGINKSDFKMMESVASDNMQKEMKHIMNIGNSFIKLKKIVIKDIEINHFTAIATVETTDIFGNVVLCSWDLIKISEVWKMNSFNFSDSQNITQTDKIEEEHIVLQDVIIKNSNNETIIETVPQNDNN